MNSDDEEMTPWDAQALFSAIKILGARLLWGAWSVVRASSTSRPSEKHLISPE
jgi:threonine/homoserine/homoserine lactone efflux protein